jgi:thiol-disulfide isomerase/thioredoxin
MLHNIYGRIWPHFSSIRGGLLLFVGLLSGLSSCRWGTNLPGKYRLMEGDWRGALLTEGGDLPFLFGLDRTGDSTFRFELIDGRDTLRTEELQVVGDSLIVRFPVFESVLIAGISQGGDSLVGRLVKVKNDVESSIPCTATRGGKYKFAARVSRLPDEVGGIWATTFYKADGDSQPAIGSFSQTGSAVSGTFRTPFGDYRYLDGIMDGDSLFLSGFDGSGAYLVRACLLEDQSLVGMLFAGSGPGRRFVARNDPSASLPDPLGLTRLRNPGQRPDFQLTGIDGGLVGPQVAGTAGKVVVIQILGSWCPNCLDETALLAQWREEYAPRGFEVIGLGFERTKQPEKARDNLRRLAARFGARYPMAVAGSPDSASVHAVLPMLERFIAYPTTLFLDRTGRIRKVHTGFDGPATGVAHTRFVAETRQFIEDLLAEPAP